MQIPQGVHINTRIAKLHARAESGIGHPRGHRRDYPRGHFDMQYITIGAAALLVHSQTTSVVRMPAIVDLDCLPDMGRMTPR